MMNYCSLQVEVACTVLKFNIPEGSRTAKGRAVVNLLPLTEGETVVKLLCLREAQDKNLVLVTKKGTIKKTKMHAFRKIRSTGIRAVSLDDGDELAFCGVSSGSDAIVIASSNGQGIHFKEKEVRAMGRQAAGVRGIKLREDDFVVGMEVISDNKDLLFATERGYGKRVRVEDFRVAHRGGLGVKTIPVDVRNGHVIGLVRVSEDSEVLLIDVNGKIIRLSPKEIRTMRRSAKGVRLIRLDSKQRLASVVAFEESVEEIVEKEKEELEKSLLRQGSEGQAEAIETEAVEKVETVEKKETKEKTKIVDEPVVDSSKKKDKK